MNQKAALQLSVEVIILFVLGLSVLGLAVIYVVSQFSALSGSAAMIQQETKEQLLQDLRSGNERLVFPYQTLRLEKDETKDIVFGVYNPEAEKLEYEISLAVLRKQGLETSLSKEGLNFFYLSGLFFLQPGEAGVNVARVEAKEPGTYLTQITILDQAGSEFASKTFFVEAR